MYRIQDHGKCTELSSDVENLLPLTFEAVDHLVDILGQFECGAAKGDDAGCFSDSCHWGNEMVKMVRSCSASERVMVLPLRDRDPVNGAGRVVG